MYLKGIPMRHKSDMPRIHPLELPANRLVPVEARRPMRSGIGQRSLHSNSKKDSLT